MQLPSAVLTLGQVLVQSTWTMLTVMAVKVTSLTVHTAHFSAVTMATRRMLEWDVKVDICILQFCILSWMTTIIYYIDCKTHENCFHSSLEHTVLVESTYVQNTANDFVQESQNKSYVHVPFWHNFDGPFYSNNGTYSTLPLMAYIYLPFLADLCTQLPIGTRTFSTKNGMVNLCANNGSFVNHSWHICALRYL